MVKKINTLVALLLLVGIATLTIVAADQTVMLCLTNGEVVEFSKCNPSIPDYHCTATTCQLCAKRLDSGIYCSRSPNVCNGLDLTCSNTNGTSKPIDQEPPILNVTSPQEGYIYGSKKVMFDLSASEVSTFYYKHEEESKWRKLSRGVAYNKAVSLQEGQNNISIRAVDSSGNIAEINKSFSIDSKAPKITKLFPKKGFADGTFNVEIKEASPKELKLHYGNSDTGMRESNVNLNNCTVDKDKRKCGVGVNLDDYDGESIEYWFTLKDIADTVAESKHLPLDVDTTDPIIVNLNYTIIAKSVKFDIEVNEDHFNSVEYLDSSVSNPQWKQLCSRLKNNVCSVKKSFSNGDHDLSVQVTDEAGNSVAQNINFLV